MDVEGQEPAERVVGWFWPEGRQASRWALGHGELKPSVPTCLSRGCHWRISASIQPQCEVFQETREKLSDGAGWNSQNWIEGDRVS